MYINIWSNLLNLMNFLQDYFAKTENQFCDIDYHTLTFHYTKVIESFTDQIYKSAVCYVPTFNNKKMFYLADHVVYIYPF